MAVALNFDLFDEPVVKPKTHRLAYILEFLESIEGPIIAKHFEKRKNLLIHSFMMATAETTTPPENVYLIQKMEEEILTLAKRKGFVGVFTTNANELTRVTGNYSLYTFHGRCHFPFNPFCHSLANLHRPTRLHRPV